jgi:S1-C subfamily serine protease
VSPDGPADRAGVAPGDIILAVGGESVRTQAEFYRKVWARGGAGESIPLKLLQGVDVKEVPVASIDRTDYFKRPTTY